MKKILSLALVLFSVLALSACQDQKSYDTQIKVQFFADVIEGNNPADIENLNAGDLIAKPADPEKTGFRFGGWYTEITLENEWDFDTDTIGDSSMILFAKWEPGIYTLTFELNGGELVSGDVLPETYTAGESIVLPQVRRDGFTFVSWYDYPWVDESSTKPGDPGYQIISSEQVGDLTLYAHYESITVRIAFKTNYPVDGEGPEKPEVQYVAYGTELALPDFQDTDDYTFVGWCTLPDGTGTYFETGDVLTRTIKFTLFAIWEAKP